MTTPASGIRRSAINRVPIFRRILALMPEPGLSRRGRIRWLRRVLLLLALLLLAAAAIASCGGSMKPSSLAHSQLVGPRLTAGPVCIEEAVDVSGSMTRYQTERERAERALFDFARRELRRNDLLSEAYFAGSGKLALPPSSLVSLTTPPGVPAGLNPDGTHLAPAVNVLVAARSRRLGRDRCALRALVVITDGQIMDQQATLATALRAASYARIFAVIPSETGWSRPAPLSGGIRDSIAVYHFAGPGLAGRAASLFAGAKPLDVVFGDIIGSLTGQNLARR